ncbi:MAG: tetratricopeptide repeat protein [Pirellulales bacterium]|nr:tetratricopeptide repeat protein [Pirellulales bacterium]
MHVDVRGWSRWLGAYVAIWLALVAAHAKTLTSPPYCDFAMGLFTEANFLVETGYDYQRLRYEEATANEGGTRSYMISALPTLVALLMERASTTTTVLLVSHLFTLACAALVLTLLLALLAPRIGWLAAALVCLALSVTPLWSVQTEMLGLDLPMSAFGLLAMWLALRGQGLAAALATIAAFAMKSTGIIVTIAVCALLGYEIAMGLLRRRVATRWQWGALAAAVAALAGQFWLFRWSSIGDRLTRADEMPFELVRFSDVLGVCPDVMGLTLVASLGWLAILVVGAFRMLRTRGTGDAISRLDPFAPLAWLVIVGNLLAVALYVQFPISRYFTLMAPLVLAMLAIALFRYMPHWLATTALVALIALNIANLHGRLFPAAGRWPRNAASLERSHEYYADHLATIAGTRALEAQQNDGAIVALHPFTYYLRYPRLGYVTKPVPFYAANVFRVEGGRNVANLFADHPAQLIFVAVDNIFRGFAHLTIPDAGPGDTVYYDDQQRSPLVVFRRDLSALAGNAKDLDDYYLQQFWLPLPHDMPNATPLATRALLLASHGQPNQGLELLRLAVAAHPDDVAARLELAKTALRTSGWPEVAAHAEHALALEPNSALAWQLLGAAQMGLNRHEEAIRSLARSVALAPRVAEAQHQLAMSYGQVGQLAKAREHFEAALAIDPAYEPARRALGLLKQSRGAGAEAPPANGAG